ncbi:hypothetical protein ANO11243_029240 [Dothideomycetidae sp. 11243]|nr:hypothetical protein ANO11243_029240 [fungal sp. No.11243]
MGRFFPLYMRRSDGQIETKTRHKQPEPNEPTKEQLDRTPDANGISDFYREVDLEEQKHLDWRRKLGGMLARDLGHSDSDRGYMLVAFPNNYRLYEHVKRAEDESKAKTVKNHAGGGNERQDAYLYGHPMGRKKRFRSPADFYPHLYWLATDEEGDPDNCACKICCPEEIDDKSASATKKESKNEAKQEPRQISVQEQKPAAPAASQSAPKKQPTPNPTPTPTPTLASVKQVQQVQSKTTVPQSKTSLVAAPRVQQQVQQSVIMYTNEDQRLDLVVGGFLFRQGELVWFSRGTAWGLGVISRRWMQNGAPNYTIQPLSHPFEHPTPKNIMGDSLLRPWLAWSVPDFTHAGLNTFNATYEAVDWNGIRQGQYGKGDLEVDGSILAAKAIDLSYTPFEPISAQPLGKDVFQTAYNGVYVGAERVWRGDVVRLRSGNGMDVMTVSAILENTIFSPANQQVTSQKLTLQGDIYRPGQQSASTAATPNISSLPQRLANDLQRRNASIVSRQGFTSTFTRLETASVDIKDVKGRWYESFWLGPVLLGAAPAEQLLSRGELGEIGARMNARLDCRKGSNIPQARRAERIEAFGAAVPRGFVVEGTPQPQQGFSSAGYDGATAASTAGAMDEFMNLDG